MNFDMLSHLRQVVGRLRGTADERPLTLAELAMLNSKFFGYDLARSLAAALPARAGLEPRAVSLRSKPSTQADLESDWVAYWAGQLGVAVIFHRKLWELCYVLQALWERDCIRTGALGLSFGCGRESLPAYLASRGVFVTATDQPAKTAAAQGWIKTSQHASASDHLYFEHLCSRDDFNRHVSWRDVDMNAIPPDLRNFDFCWSVCAFEHLGSIERGFAFVERAMETLRPGGVAIHTTEFNFLNDNETLTTGATVLFLRRHLEELRDRLTARGHMVEPLDFEVGDKPLDKFIDGPPFPVGPRSGLVRFWPDAPHIKVACEGYPTTCYGLIIRRG